MQPTLKPLVLPARPGRSAELLTAEDLADELRICLRSVWRCVEHGRLPPPSIRFSRKFVRWRRGEVAAYLASGDVATLAPSAEQDNARELTTDDVADLLGASRQTVYRLLKRGLLPPPNRQGRRPLHWPASALTAHLDMLANGASVPSA